jgi:two-component system chemotaxis sensor kinase CheA
VSKDGNRTVTVPEPPVAATGGADGRLVDDEIVAEFVSRQADLLEQLENLVLDIEISQTDADLPDLMRYFHTLKGESALLGFEDISQLAHVTEDMLQREPLVACVDRILEVKDWLVLAFAHLAGDGEMPTAVDELMDDLDRDARIAVAPPSLPTAEPEPAATPLAHPNLFDLDADMLQDFIAETTEHLEAAEAHLLDLESDTADEEAINAVFRCFHTIKGVAGFVEMDHIKNLAHKSESLLDRVRKGELQLHGDPMDLALASVDMLKRLGQDVAAAMAGDGKLPHRDELSVLIARLAGVCAGTASGVAGPPDGGTDAPGPPPAAAGTDDGSGSGLFILPKSRKAKPAPTAPPPLEAPAAEAPQAATPQRKGVARRREAVRVDADRLDLLVETVGELVIAEAMVSQNRQVRDLESVELARHLDHLDKICRELQQIGMSLRMVPVRPIFQKMARLVRDLAKKSGRQIEFEFSGEETELDKSVVEKLGDPLVHMLRNAVDHGIEADTADRVKAGKPAAGRIRLRALHQGGFIIVEVEDDGRGLDRDAILAKAVERGIIAEGGQLGDQEIFGLIFEPGFSTASEVTDVSGRGVGMDVVRRNIEKLRGSVDIVSEPGKGSVFSFKLPLTLAIIEGMVFLCGGERYIVPTQNVLRLVRPDPDDYGTVLHRGEVLRFEGEIIPLIRLYEMFGVEGAHESFDEAVVIVAESGGRSIGLLTDELVGQQQIVIKNLGEQVQGTVGLAGGAIMSDGNVALILDIEGLIKIAGERGATGREAGGRS